MKKFLTVLMVVAVLFTFSFGSAFAAVPWTGETTVKYLTEATDYSAPTGPTSTNGTEGITEAYRAQLTALVKAVGTTGYAAPEAAKIKALKATALDEIAAAKTAKAAYDAKAKFDLEVDALDTYTTIVAAIAGATSTIDLTRLNDRYADTVTGYYLPGYGTILRAACDEIGGKFVLGADPTPVTVQDIADDDVTYEDYQFVVEWLVDNDYRTKDEIAEGVGALVAALVPVTATYMDTVKAEEYAIQAEIYKYADKYDSNHAKNQLTVADLEGIDALIVKMGEFEDKYAGLAGLTGFTTDDFDDAIEALAVKYFDVYCAEVSAVPAVSKLKAEDKANVLALYSKVNALEDTYENVWDYVETAVADGGTIEQDCPDHYACNYTGLENAYKDFLAKDVAAYGKLATFNELEYVGVAPNQTAYFDASEKNVNALKARRAAFDALVADYGYADLNTNAAATLSYARADVAEAAIIAAEHNMPTDADYDAEIEKIDTSKVQAYLNNATVKVTTKALGSKKVRVNATIDTQSFNYILGEMNDGCTVSYQFYYKKAANTAYKAGKVKDANYTTFKLTKGVKYNFQCKVVIKDADGNVVATKDYKASTVGTRTVK